MKVITWNCNMAFRKKAEYILAQKPDIVVVPECEHPDKLHFKEGLPRPNDIFWYGDNVHKGIGVFSYSDYRFTLLHEHNPSFKYILPLVATGEEGNYTLFAIWANNPKDKDGPYVTQVWKAIHYYEPLLHNANIILIGDFNSNSIWDRPKRVGNHSDVVNKLASHNIFSTYHTFHNQIQGKEEHPTQYMYRHHDKPYHLDYCFVSVNLLEKIKSVEIGLYSDWKMHSDHKPLSVEFGK